MKIFRVLLLSVIAIIVNGCALFENQTNDEHLSVNEEGEIEISVEEPTGATAEIDEDQRTTAETFPPEPCEPKNEEEHPIIANDPRALFDECLTDYGRRTNDDMSTLNVDSPTTHVEYRDSKRGLTVQFPFNPRWGTTSYKINPYEFDKWDPNRLTFGPLTGCEGGGLCRWLNSLTFLPPQSLEGRKYALERECNNSESGNSCVISDLQIVTIGEHEVLQYKEGGLCSYIVMEVAGSKQLFRFSRCGDSSEDAAFLESIVRTMKVE